jgi:voltage-gated potassium channel
VATPSPNDQSRPATPTWRERWYEIIFEADTPAGKFFDVALLIAILVSVLVVVVESVSSVRHRYGNLLYAAEWIFTILFTIEYVARIACAHRPWRYIFSFYGIVDLLAILPTYLGLWLADSAPNAQRLAVVRSLRLLRTFRILKLAHMSSEAANLRHAIWVSRSKIIVFIAFVVIVIVIVGAAMHLIEGPDHEGFTSIPQSMYWATVTLTTVGYGDVTPNTIPGKVLAVVMMLLGYSMIIVPTGIVTAALVKPSAPTLPWASTQVCPECMAEGHAFDAVFCKMCGAKL